MYLVLNRTRAFRTYPSAPYLVLHTVLVALVELPVPAVEDLPGEGMAALLEVGLHLDLPAVAGLVGQAQNVQGLCDPPVVRDGVAERGRASIAGEHADDVVRADGAGVDGTDDPQDVLPVPFDPGEIDPAAGGVLESAVVGGAVDTPHLLVRQVSELRRVREPRQGQQSEDDVAVYMDK